MPAGKTRKLVTLTLVVLIVVTLVTPTHWWSVLHVDTTLGQYQGKDDVTTLGQYQGRDDVIRMLNKSPDTFVPDPDDDMAYQIAIEPTDGCHDASSYDAVMLVHTRPTNTYNRQVFREVYRGPYMEHVKIKLLFVIGTTDNSTTSEQISAEAAAHNDVIQGKFVDHYRNMTYKAIVGLQWLDRNCRGMKLLLRIDDDTFVNIPRFMSLWRDKYAGSDDVIVCESKVKAPVQRQGQWLVTQEEFPGDWFDFPHCFGWFAAYSPSLVPKMHRVAKSLPYFWVDDILITGLVPKVLGTVKFPYENDKLKKDGEMAYRFCLLDKGERCPVLASILRPKHFANFLRWMHTCPGAADCGHGEIPSVIEIL